MAIKFWDSSLETLLLRLILGLHLLLRLYEVAEKPSPLGLKGNDEQRNLLTEHFSLSGKKDTLEQGTWAQNYRNDIWDKQNVIIIIIMITINNNNSV